MLISSRITGSYVDPETRLSPSEAVELLKDFSKAEKYARHSKNFFHIVTHNVRSPIVGSLVQNRIHIRALKSLINSSMLVNKAFTSFRIPKKSGGTRLIEAPVGEYREVLDSLAEHITDRLKVLPHNSAYAYTTGRCAYDALVTHQRRNARWFLKIDIKGFFPSITSELIHRELSNIYPFAEMPGDYLTVFSDFITNMEGELPQGSPVSPVVSNLVMVKFDQALSLALRDFNKSRYCYTRYADDIIISSPYEFRYDKVIELIEMHFQQLDLPFSIKREKTRYGSNAGRNWNLGLMYNQDQQITIGNKKKKQLNAMVHQFLSDYSDGEYWGKPEVRELQGKLAYLQNVEPKYYKKMIQKYNQKFHTNIGRLFKNLLQ